ncbi:MATE family efflux transporter [Hathewaya histolytica]|uniref:MATE family efflux transporter n=1 Tax=Hathewaya histolytica TaxID=1498 RepID=UPI003B682012
MTQKAIEQQFWKYVIPSMLTMLLAGFYAIVDGFFVGRATGDIGLAAINIAWPIAAVILAVGTGIGIGGSVIMSTLNGKGDIEGSNKARGNTIFMLIVSTIVLTLGFSITYTNILKFFGAEGKIYTAATEYIGVIAFASGLQLFGTGLAPLIRNSGKSIIAMSIMISGLIANIILDALFIMVLGLGIYGAAIATVTAQGLVAVASLIVIFCDKKNKFKVCELKPDWILISKMIKIGMAPFGLSLSPSVIIIFANWQCINYGGEVAVAAYSVISYVVASIQSLLQGVGDGIQPLISFCNGSRQYNSMNKILKKAILTVIIISAIIFIAIIPARNVLPSIFGSSKETAIVIKDALFLSSFAFPLIGIVRLSAAYFYAVGSTRFSSLLVYSDALIITPVLLILLPRILGLRGIWLSLVVAQGILMILVGFMFNKHYKSLKEEMCIDNEGNKSA